jgi:peptidoglycan biosynthesis protein MviN/MurJ (putative lipid II flippase)
MWRALRYALIVLAIGMAFSFVVFALLLAGGFPGAAFLGRWLALGIETAIVVGSFVHHRRRRWGHARFWLVLGGCVVARTALLVALESQFERWNPMWWVFLMPLDYLATAVATDALDLRSSTTRGSWWAKG